MQKTAILILAAGSSSRMGEPKQLLPYKNTTLLGHSIEQAQQSGTKDIFCVLGANTTAVQESITGYQIKAIYNPNYKKGLSTSIITGINYLIDKNFDSVLIMLADQPNVNSAYLNELIKVSVENSSKIIVSNYGKKNGVPAVFPRNYFQQLLNLQGDEGARELLNNHQSEIVKMPIFNLIDIDTIEDYQKLIN